MVLREQLMKDGYGPLDEVRLAIHDVGRAEWFVYKVMDIPEKYLNHECTCNPAGHTYILEMICGWNCK